MKPIIVHNKPVKFCRYGGLSRKHQKGYGSETYHAPPTRRGFYAFVWPYVEFFLLTGYTQNQEKLQKGDFKPKRRRIFEYYGNIWHHFDSAKGIIATHNSWYKSSYEDYCEALRQKLHSHKTDAIADMYTVNHRIELGRSGNVGYYSKDHLEVFIEDKRM